MQYGKEMLSNLRNALPAVSKMYKISSLSFGNEVNKCKPQHLICFKDWTSDMVLDVLISAMSLKVKYPATSGCKRLAILENSKVTILQEVNQPALSLAVSKAATLLGGYDVTVVDSLMWDHDYFGRVFSLMSDVIFVSTSTHMCVQRFSQQSTVPVICMITRTHANVQALATIMTILEEFGSFHQLNIAYVGPPHPVLNSYLLLCPMLGANIKFKCCCEKCPVSPLLYNISAKMVKQSHTISQPCTCTNDVLSHASVIIAGPTTTKGNIDKFRLTEKDDTNKEELFGLLSSKHHPMDLPINKEIYVANGPERAEVLPVFHELSGCDTVSSFNGRGKKSAFEAWNLFSFATEGFKDLKDGNINEAEIVLHKFVIAMYDRSSPCPCTTINHCRKYLFTKTDRQIENLPPTEAALRQHILRAACQGVHEWGQALVLQQILPSPPDWGWKQKISQ